MEYLAISRIAVTIVTLGVTWGLYRQAFKLVQSKSVDDFDPVLVVFLVILEVAWMNYGLALGEWPIMLTSGLNIPAAVAIAFGYFRYRGGKNHD